MFTSRVLRLWEALLQGDQLAGTWTTALQLGPFGRVAALQAALEFIGTSAPPIASVSTGRSSCSCSKSGCKAAAFFRKPSQTQPVFGPHVLTQMLLNMKVWMPCGVHSDPEDFLLVRVLQLSRH